MIPENLASLDLDLDLLFSIIVAVIGGGFALYKHRRSSMPVRSRLKIDLEIMELAKHAGIEASVLEEDIKDRLAILYQRSKEKRTFKLQHLLSKETLKLLLNKETWGLLFNADVFAGLLIVVFGLGGSVVLLINKLYLGSVIAAFFSLLGVSQVLEGYKLARYNKEKLKLDAE